MTDFGFLAMMMLIDMDMLSESRNQYQRMSALLDHIPASVCVKDLEGRFLFINRGFEEFFHVKNADIYGKTAFDLFPAVKPMSSALKIFWRSNFARRSGMKW